MSKGILILNEYGYFPAGFHDMTQDEIISSLVENFPDSKTRKIIFDGYVNFCQNMINCGIKNFVQWLDGSFCTSKENPNDIDIVTIIDDAEFKNLNEKQKNNLKLIAERTNAKSRYKCDSFILIAYPKKHDKYKDYINNYMYWRGVWGFDRNDIPKGIIRVTYGKGIQDE